MTEHISAKEKNKIDAFIKSLGDSPCPKDKHQKFILTNTKMSPDGFAYLREQLNLHSSKLKSLALEKKRFKEMMDSKADRQGYFVKRHDETKTEINFDLKTSKETKKEGKHSKKEKKKQQKLALLINKNKELWDIINKDANNKNKKKSKRHVKRLVTKSMLDFRRGKIVFDKYRYYNDDLKPIDYKELTNLRGYIFYIFTDEKNNTFRFEKEQDVDIIIESIENAYKGRTERDVDTSESSSNTTSPSSTKSIIEIPWKFVLFHNGYIRIFNPEYPKNEDKSYCWRYSMVTSSFNNISEIFISRLSPIKAICQNERIIEIINVPDLYACIEVLRKHQLIPDYEFQEVKSSKRPVPISLQDAKERIKYKKSIYLKYLSERHLSGEKVYYCLEVRSNSNEIPVDEDGFMFVLSLKEGKYNVIFENCLPFRASIVFEVEETSFNKAIYTIYNFFASDKVNKRRELQHHHISFRSSGILNYSHVRHSDFHEWKLNINKYI